MKKIAFYLAAIAIMLIGCDNHHGHKSYDVILKIKGIDLKGAKAIAHLQSNDGTRASVNVNNQDALYLVYDNNEVRLPEYNIEFQIPDDLPEEEKEYYLSHIHLDLSEPMIFDLGKYIAIVQTYHCYWDDPNDSFLDRAPIAAIMGDNNTIVTVVRKKDGYCARANFEYVMSICNQTANMRTAFDSKENLYSMSYDMETNAATLSKTTIVGDTVVSKKYDFEYPVAYVSTGLVPWIAIDKTDRVFGAVDVYYSDGSTVANLMTLSSSGNMTTACFEGLFYGLFDYADQIYMATANYNESGEPVLNIYNVSNENTLVSSKSINEVGNIEFGEYLGHKDGVICWKVGDNNRLVKYDSRNQEYSINEVSEDMQEYLITHNMMKHHYNGCVYAVKDCGTSIEVHKVDFINGTVEVFTSIEVPAGTQMTHYTFQPGIAGCAYFKLSFNDGSSKLAMLSDSESLSQIEIKTHKVVNVVPLQN